MTGDILPRTDEVEISLFGPGVGESAVVHLGNGEWIVIDSCKANRAEQSAPLRYLSEIGVDLTDVKRVIATHAHNDHIEGIAELFEACDAAYFVHPLASHHEDFYALLDLDGMIDARPSAYSEYARVMNSLEERKASTGKVFRQGVKDGSLIFKREPSDVDPGAEVIALAPSETAMQLAVQEFGRWKDLKEQTPRRLRAEDPNTFCAVLWIKAGDAIALMGSDLLADNSGDYGWRAVLSSPTLPSEKASCYKVAHHGAPNGHEPEVWEKLLEENPLALLTAYWTGRRPRPQPADRETICQLTRRAYITSKPEVPAQPATTQKEAALLRSVATNVRRRKGLMGHVRARRRVDVAGADWEVTVNPPARALCE